MNKSLLLAASVLLVPLAISLAGAMPDDFQPAAVIAMLAIAMLTVFSTGALLYASKPARYAVAIFGALLLAFLFLVTLEH